MDEELSLPVWEYALLHKLVEVFKVAKKVKKSDVAKFLGLTEEELFELLISWGQALPIKIKEDLIVIKQMKEFKAALETWKVENPNREVSISKEKDQAPAIVPTTYKETAPSGTNYEEAPVVDRPLTDTERDFLKKSLKTGPFMIMQVMGALIGLITLMFLAMTILGDLSVADNNYYATCIVLIILIAIFSGIGGRGRTPIMNSIKNETAYEVWGVPEDQSPYITLGGITFSMKESQIANLFAGRMNKITFADGGFQGLSSIKRQFFAVILDWNGIASNKPEICPVTDGFEADESKRKMRRKR